MTRLLSPLLLAAAALSLLPLLEARETGARAQFTGGTVLTSGQPDGTISLTDNQEFLFRSRGYELRVPYAQINVLEYGQQSSRRIAEAILISPLALAAKKRKHFLTLGYRDDSGRQQSIVFRLGKESVRTVLTGLEARTGRRVEYQDDDARRSGKGM